MPLGECIITTLGSFVLHLIPGTIIILLAGVGWKIAPLIVALAPPNANYVVSMNPATASQRGLYLSDKIPTKGARGEGRAMHRNIRPAPKDVHPKVVLTNQGRTPSKEARRAKFTNIPYMAAHNLGDFNNTI